MTVKDEAPREIRAGDRVIDSDGYVGTVQFVVTGLAYVRYHKGYACDVPVRELTLKEEP